MTERGEFRETRPAQKDAWMVNGVDLALYQYLPPVIASPFKKIVGQTSIHDDLVQSGYIGLIEAANRYDEEKCSAFAPYAQLRVRGAILDELRTHNIFNSSVFGKTLAVIQRAEDELLPTLGRLPTATEISKHTNYPFPRVRRVHSFTHPVSLDAPLQGTLEDLTIAEVLPAPGVDTSYEDVELDILLTSVPNGRWNNERDMRILRMYYIDGMSQKEIGKVYQLTEVRISQIRTRALERFRELIDAA